MIYKLKWELNSFKQKCRQHRHIFRDRTLLNEYNEIFDELFELEDEICNCDIIRNPIDNNFFGDVNQI